MQFSRPAMDAAEQNEPHPDSDAAPEEEKSPDKPKARTRRCILDSRENTDVNAGGHPIEKF